MVSARPVEDGRAVQLHLEVRFQDDFVALSTFDEEPIACRTGDGTFTPAFETSLKTLREGSDVRLTVDGSTFFGPYEEAKCHWIERGVFPGGLDPMPGQLLGFVTAAGQEASGIVLEREDQRVLVDFNHPFSGRALRLRIKVLAVNP